MPTISVLTPTFGRRDKLGSFLLSLVEATGFDKTEVLILINGEDGPSEELLKKYSVQYPNIRYFSSEKKSRGAARNELILKASGDICYFLDDDVVVEKTIFSVVQQKFQQYQDVDILGGPNLTPPDSTLFQNAQGYVLSSVFGAFWMSQRYRISKTEKAADERSLILCNLAIKRRVFEKRGVFFDPLLVCAEENLLLQQLMRFEHKAMFIPDMAVYHERRRTHQEFCRQIFIYGRGRGQIIRYLPRPICFLCYALALFFLYLFFLILFISPGPRILIVTYVFSCFLFSLAIALINKNIKFLPVSFFLFQSVHIFYGIGFIKGFLKRL